MYMRELLTKVVSNLGMKGLSVILALGMQIILARWLSVAEYGQFALLQVVAMGFATFAQAGMQTAYMKLVAELNELYGVYAITKICLQLVVRHLALALFVYLVVVVCFYSFGKISSAITLIAFSFYLIFQTFMMLLLAWFRGVNKAYIASFLEQGSFAGLTVVFGFIWLAVTKTEWPLHIAAISFAAATGIVFILVVVPVISRLLQHKQDVYEPDALRVKQLSRRLLTMQMAAYFTNWSGVLVVGLFLATDQVAGLNVAQRLAQIVVFFLIAFNGVIAPRFAKLNANGDMVGLRKLAQRSANLLTLATLPVVLVTVIWGKLILAVFGEQYIAAYPLLVIIMAGQLINALTGSVGFLLNMTNHEQIMRNIVVTSSVITVLVSIIATTLFGVVGAASALTLGLVINNLTAAYFVFKYFGFVTIPGFHWIKKHAD